MSLRNFQPKLNRFVSVSHSILRTKATSTVEPLFIQAEKFKDRVALIDQHGHHRYGQLVYRASTLTQRIKKLCNVSNSTVNKKLNIAILCPNDVSYVVSLWSTWMVGGVAVPLCKNIHSEKQLNYFLADSQSKLVMYTEEDAEKIQGACHHLNIKKLQLGKDDYLRPSNPVKEEDAYTVATTEFQRVLAKDEFRSRDALIIYDSGTMLKPKVCHETGLLFSVLCRDTSWLDSFINTVLHPSPLKILRSRVFHLYSSLILIGLLGNFWLKTVFVLE